MENRYQLGDGPEQNYDKEVQKDTEVIRTENDITESGNNMGQQEPSTVFEYNYSDSGKIQEDGVESKNQNSGFYTTSHSKYSRPENQTMGNPQQQSYGNPGYAGYSNTGNAPYTNATYTGSNTGHSNTGYSNTGNAAYTNAAYTNNNYTGANYGNYTNEMNSGYPPKKQKKKKGVFGKQLAKCVALALVFGLVGGGVFHSVGYLFRKPVNVQDVTNGEIITGVINDKVTTTSTSTQAVVSDVSEVVENVMPSIVSITNMSVQEYQGWFGQVYSEEIPNAGSGIIVSQTEGELYIVTNNHVVENSSSLTVNFVDNVMVSATIKGTDSSTDLAVITVKVEDIPEETLQQIKVATLGDSGKLKVGEPSIAIGNALGYGQSVTTGVISALNREVTVTDSQKNAITNSLIQTDAAINPGNSGGALLNIKGEVIGINSVKYSDTDVEGMGYAIPMATAEPIINDLITMQVVDEADSAYLGVSGVDVTEEVSSTYNMPKGVYVAQVVPSSAAEAAGIQPGDIITSFDGRKIETMESLVERMQYYASGTVVEVIVQTPEQGGYTERIISVTLGRKN